MKAGWGIVVRDNRGRLLATWAVPRLFSRNVKMEEAIAIRRAVELATLEGWKRVQIESDCKEIVEKLMKKDWNDKWIGMILEDISRMSCFFEKCCFSFVKRNCNFVSHSLAHFALNCCEETSWRTSFPVWLVHAAREDFESNCSPFCT